MYRHTRVTHWREALSGALGAELQHPQCSAIDAMRRMGDEILAAILKGRRRSRGPPRGETLLDVFAGSGASLVAALMQGVAVAKYYWVDVDINAMLVVLEVVRWALEAHADLVGTDTFVNMFRVLDVRGLTADEIRWMGPTTVIGGSPCQGFSTAQQDASRAGLLHPQSALFLNFLDVIRSALEQPEHCVVLFENVEAFADFVHPWSELELALPGESFLHDGAVIGSCHRRRFLRTNELGVRWTTLPEPDTAAVSWPDACAIFNAAASALSDAEPEIHEPPVLVAPKIATMHNIIPGVDSQWNTVGEPVQRTATFMASGLNTYSMRAPGPGSDGTGAGLVRRVDGMLVPPHTLLVALAMGWPLELAKTIHFAFGGDLREVDDNMHAAWEVGRDALDIMTGFGERPRRVGVFRRILGNSMHVGMLRQFWSARARRSTGGSDSGDSDATRGHGPASRKRDRSKDAADNTGDAADNTGATGPVFNSADEAATPKRSLMFVKCHINGVPARCLVDSGCSLPLLLECSAATRFGLEPSSLAEARSRITVGDGHIVDAFALGDVSINVAGFVTTFPATGSKLSGDGDGVLGKPWIERCEEHALPGTWDFSAIQNRIRFKFGQDGRVFDVLIGADVPAGAGRPFSDPLGRDAARDDAQVPGSADAAEADDESPEDVELELLGDELMSTRTDERGHLGRPLSRHKAGPDRRDRRALAKPDDDAIRASVIGIVETLHAAREGVVPASLGDDWSQEELNAHLRGLMEGALNGEHFRALSYQTHREAWVTLFATMHRLGYQSSPTTRPQKRVLGILQNGLRMDFQRLDAMLTDGRPKAKQKMEAVWRLLRRTVGEARIDEFLVPDSMAPTPIHFPNHK